MVALVVVFSAPRAPAFTSSSAADRAAGEVLFHDAGCVQCHGPNGAGTEKGPSLSRIGRRWKSDQITEQIVHGGGGMPAFADVLDADQTRQLVEYLRAKRK